jgi:hypothetical protein
MRREALQRSGAASVDASFSAALLISIGPVHRCRPSSSVPAQFIGAGPVHRCRLGRVWLVTLRRYMMEDVGRVFALRIVLAIP